MGAYKITITLESYSGINLWIVSNLVTKNAPLKGLHVTHMFTTSEMGSVLQGVIPHLLTDQQIFFSPTF